jgi:SM-20-related protein
MPDEPLQRVANALYEQGWSVEEAFLPPEQTLALALESRAAWKAGEFRRAGIGTGRDLHFDRTIRSDHVHWLHEEPVMPAQRRYFDRLEALRRTLNENLQLGLFGFEGHFAVYPPGAFYKKHLDQFRGARHRRVSTIFYLNRDWQAHDGGQLRLYLSAAGEGEHVDVEPRAGTLVTFLSERFYHEVLPAQRERMSLTGWFRTRD